MKYPSGIGEQSHPAVDCLFRYLKVSSVSDGVHSLTIEKGREGVVEEWATQEQNGSERRIEEGDKQRTEGKDPRKIGNEEGR
ncbi:hypothetical protein G5I_05633 [Acromyrmex echinatior]|uniref:Uncharacterized protein n=1 Tax=Acromyrmex echinatior TaxID=103372 RepID=F4WIV7_ACREC|nr:hypothetical protein G5I_05633 [Acromyrmex echinatior]